MARDSDPKETARGHLRNALAVLSEANDANQEAMTAGRPFDTQIVVEAFSAIQDRIIEALAAIEAGRL